MGGGCGNELSLEKDDSMTMILRMMYQQLLRRLVRHSFQIAPATPSPSGTTVKAANEPKKSPGRVEDVLRCVFLVWTMHGELPSLILRFGLMFHSVSFIQTGQIQVVPD